mmetsp:Transcript_5190/g.14581  ORF Transcript_5190/g.14581 Transcript_5190/m.14581 type:complete len:88 (+) Transcript_5190:16-279(+)
MLSVCRTINILYDTLLGDNCSVTVTYLESLLSQAAVGLLQLKSGSIIKPFHNTRETKRSEVCNLHFYDDGSGRNKINPVHGVSEYRE